MKTKGVLDFYRITIGTILLSLLIGIVVLILFIDAQSSPVAYVLLIASTIASLTLATLQWLSQRNAASVRIKTDGQTILAQNITTREALRLAELFQTLQKGHFSIVDEGKSQDLNRGISSHEQITSDTTSDVERKIGLEDDNDN